MEVMHSQAQEPTIHELRTEWEDAAKSLETHLNTPDSVYGKLRSEDPLSREDIDVLELLQMQTAVMADNLIRASNKFIAKCKEVCQGPAPVGHVVPCAAPRSIVG